MVVIWIALEKWDIPYLSRHFCELLGVTTTSWYSWRKSNARIKPSQNSTYDCSIICQSWPHNRFLTPELL